MDKVDRYRTTAIVCIVNMVVLGVAFISFAVVNDNCHKNERIIDTKVFELQENEAQRRGNTQELSTEENQKAQIQFFSAYEKLLKEQITNQRNANYHFSNILFGMVLAASMSFLGAQIWTFWRQRQSPDSKKCKT